MRQLVLVFVEVALHRKGPEALPASRFLFGLVLASYLTVSLLALQIKWPLSQAMSAMILDVALYLAFFGVVLRALGRSHRFLQTVTAVLGAETFLSCLALPLLFTRPAEANGNASEVFVTSLLLLILLWSIDIAGFVLSRALDRPYIVGVLIMIGYVISSMMLGEFFFPSVN